MNQRNQNLIYIILVVLAIGVTVALVNQSNNEPETRLGRAVDEIGDGVKDAGRELDPNRTPGEKFGDAIDDLGDDIQDATEGN